MLEYLQNVALLVHHTVHVASMQVILYCSLKTCMLVLFVQAAGVQWDFVTFLL